MVVFVCGACGGSFKRKQAESHSFRCRNWHFSCMDCNKDFPGQTYVQHNQCISESEKYFGSHHVAKEGKDKNEIWLEKVRTHLGAQKNLKPFHARLVARMLTFPNIPRKQAKFENFVKTNMNIIHATIVQDLWNLVEGANAVSLEACTPAATDKSNKENSSTANGVEPSSETAQSDANESNSDTPKNKKRKSVGEPNGSAEDCTEKPKKKKKKRLVEDFNEAAANDSSVEESVQKESKSQRRKKRKQFDSATEEPDMLLPSKLAVSNCGERDFADYEDIAVETVTVKNNFKWRATVKKLLRGASKPDEGMKINKLLNKIEQLHNHPLHGSAQPLPRNTLQEILMKILAKSPFSIANNRAKVGKFAVAK